ncbi:methyltransferase domain-containing protein [Candidatus Falkowbacteria bacterium]|nr:methyltransferase domain-containing protein [Candidatus Falkowbacteria bacterium]
MDLKTIQTYNQKAQDYDQETIDFWQLFPKPFISQFKKLAVGNVLDIGSGPGRDGLILKQEGLEVTCLEASEAMVEICQARGLNSVLGDFNNLPFADQTFGGVWSYTSLLHIPKSEVSQVLSEIKRVLKTDGVFGLGLIEGDTEGYRDSFDSDMTRWFSFYTKSEVEELLRFAGFEIIYFEEFKPRSKNYLNFIAKKI